MRHVGPERSTKDRLRSKRSAIRAGLATLTVLLVVGLLLTLGCSKAPSGAPSAQAVAGQQAPTNPDEAAAPGPPPGLGGPPDAEPRGAGRSMAEHPDELKLPPAKGRLVYVSAKAESSGDGSRERPWADLQAALRQLRKGDRLTLLPGEYQGPIGIGEGCADGTAQEPIEVVGRVNAVLRVRTPAPVVTVKRSGWSFLGLDIVAGEAATAAVEVLGARDLLFFRCHLHGGGGDGMLIGPESKGITLAQVHIHGFGRSGGRPDQRREVIGLRIAPGTRGITVKGSKIQNIAGPPVKVLTPAEFGPGPDGKPYQPAAGVDLGNLETVANWPEKN